MKQSKEGLGVLLYNLPVETMEDFGTNIQLQQMQHIVSLVDSEFVPVSVDFRQIRFKHSQLKCRVIMMGRESVTIHTIT